jgi:molybdate/tungstate transport system ATP-binding protein
MIEAKFHTRVGVFELNASLSSEGMILLSGPNGSGKTTFLKAVAGYFSIDSGSVVVNSVNITDMTVSARKAVYIGTGSSINSLGVKDHVSWPKSPLGSAEKEKIMSLLGIDFDGRVGNLSLGQRIRVSIATAIISEARILLIDEVLANISRMQEFIMAMKELTTKSGMDVIVAMQTDELRDHFDHSYTIDKGFLIRLK